MRDPKGLSISLYDPTDGPDFNEDWLQEFTQAGQMFCEWASGTGDYPKEFGPDSAFTEYLMDEAQGVEEAREEFHDKNEGKENPEPHMYPFKFGPGELYGAGVSPTGQFLGSYNVSIYPSHNGMKRVKVWNRTSMTSASYHRLPSWSRGRFGPGGNMDQTYSWEEPYGR